MEELQNKNINTNDSLGHRGSFQGFLSISTWKEVAQIVRKYFVDHEDIFRLIGINVALVGLFLNLKSDDIYLKRVEVFFLLSACVLITWFIIKSVLNLYYGKHTELYYAIVLTPAYIGGILIFNLWKFLLNSFSTELLFYFNFIGVPLIAIGVNLISIAFLKLARKVKNIEGGQLENFFLITLNLKLVSSYIFSNYNFPQTVSKLLSFEFDNLVILYFFFITFLSELHSFDKKSKKRIIAEAIFFGIMIVFPFLIKYILVK